MKLAIVNSYCIQGIEAHPVRIEVHISNGLPGLSIVGLPEAAVRESKDRVRSALITSGFDYPARRMTVNLAPADLPKIGAGLDLPITLGILLASDQIKCQWQKAFAVVGELSLSGLVRPVPGLLPMAMRAQRDNLAFIAPSEDAENTSLLSLLDSQETRTCESLTQLAAYLANPESDTGQLNPLPPFSLHESSKETELCLSQVQGQLSAKRALEIAAAGGHNLLMVGPPGTGKTMLANRMASLLPPLDKETALEVASIYSVADQRPIPLVSAPVREINSGISMAALLGGGSHHLKPGEISLSHRGVLFLDEIAEFPMRVLESLRQPMESGHILISRATSKTRFPAVFQLIATMNPCPCGYLGETRCRCTPTQVERYANRLSGPILDRIDLRVTVTRPPQRNLFDTQSQTSSRAIRARVCAARQRQLKRQGSSNAHIGAGQMVALANDNAQARETLIQAAEQLDLSTRAVHRLLKVARTIADLDNSDQIEKTHMLEALHFRQDHH